MYEICEIYIRIGATAVRTVRMIKWKSMYEIYTKYKKYIQTINED